MATEAKTIKDKFSQLESDRGTYSAHLDELVDNLMPFRQNYNRRETGAKKLEKILDSTGVHGLLLFAAGIMGKMTNAGSDWFDITTEIDELSAINEVKLWLDKLKRAYINIFNKSNFYAQLHECYIDIGGFGMGPFSCLEHPRTLCYFKAISPIETYISDNRYGEVDTVYRLFTMTARQMVQQWGEAKLSDSVQVAAKDKPFTTFEIIHGIYPRNDRQPGKEDKVNKPIASCYIERNSVTLLSESGFEDMPIMIPRFFIASGEVYGRGPGMLALPDVKMLNRMESDILKAGQKKLSPPLLVPDDGFMGPLKLIPNGLNFFRSDRRSTMQDNIGAFPVPDDLGYAEEKLKQKRDQIRSIFYNDMLQTFHDAQMTATEVLKLAEERLQLLGPFQGRMNSELYNPTFDRIFGIMLRNGAMPAPPEIMMGQSLKINYINPLSKVQRTTEADGIARTFAFLAPLHQAGLPVMDNLDIDGAIRDFAEISGFPSKRINSTDIIEQTRKARAEQQAVEAKAAQAAQIAEIATKAVPALSKGAEPNSLMSALMGAGGEESGGLAQ